MPELAETIYPKHSKPYISKNDFYQVLTSISKRSEKPIISPHLKLYTSNSSPSRFLNSTVALPLIMIRTGL